MAAKKVGLRWRKLDLHVHTPASTDYVGPTITPAEFVELALSKGLDGIAVTDHNTAAWIDPLLAAAKGTRLAVFPGVEITTAAGESGLHIIALFDRDATSKHVEGLLARLGLLPADYGKIDAVTHRTAIEVVETIRELGGLPILAHADSSKGALRDMKGQQRIALMKSVAVAAVEVNNLEKSSKLLDGTDPDYRRKLAIYRASDNRMPGSNDGHAADGIGSKYSVFKLDGVDLASLDQCFEDPDVRIIPDIAIKSDLDRPYPRILSLVVSQGFLKGSAFTFHEGLNSIIGGKGVGKSLVVELLRFCLDQPSAVAAIHGDMTSKLEAQLGLGGSVTVEIQLETSDTVVVERNFDGASNPISAYFADSGKRITGDIGKLFPILAYSQTETLEIARDDTAQLQLIDSFIDHSAFTSRIEAARRELQDSDRRLAESLAASVEVEARSKELSTIQEQIRQLDEVLKSERHEAIKALQPKTDCLEEMKAHVSELADACRGLQESLEDCQPPSLVDELKSDLGLKALHKEVSAIAKSVVASTRALEAQLRRLAGKIAEAQAEWKKHVDKEHDAYRKWLAEQGGDRAKLAARRKLLVESKEKATKVLSNARAKAAALGGIRAARKALLDELTSAEETLFELRRQKYDEISVASNGRLRLSIERSGSRRQYLEALSTLKRGSNLHETTIASVAENVSPRELVAYILRDEPKRLASAAGIPEKVAEKLTSYLRSLEAFSEVLALEHRPLLQDTPHIQYRKDDGQYYDLKELSIGQKCTALLIIALVEGNRPIVIDQPEDALDIRSVYEDVTLQLRVKKATRQFLVTTHNATVAVAADSDQFHVLKATATKATVAAQGAMDRPVVRHEVIQHLEGGMTPFALKTKKYGVRPS